MNAELAQHLCAAAIVALIGLESEMHVGIYRVVALFLKLVCCNLVHQAYAATFLLHVYEHALAFLLNHLHGFVELFATVATHASEDVARSA